MALTDIFIKRPVLSLVVSLLILLIGFKAATSLPIRQYPKLSNTVITVTTVYPGASPELMQGFITTPIEQAVAAAEGVDYMSSSSTQGQQPDFGLHQAQRRSEPGAYRSFVEGQLGQISDSERGQRSDHPEVDRPDHGGDVYRILQRRAFGLGDLRLPDAGGAADPVHRRWRGVRRHSRWPDLCDAVVARSRANGRPWRLAERCLRRHPGQQFPGRRRPGQGLFHRLQRHHQYRSAECRTVQAHGDQGQGRRLRADAGHRHRRTRRPKHRCQRRVQRRACDLHRRAGNSAGQPAEHCLRRACAVPGNRTQPAAVPEDEGRL